ncbi:rRNA methyltransferase 3, mitochondrial [Euwallacea fornicatus]|uniref:rRNA methyltransferase 3, mitochondrial n=1 Tax=Euwallacea fornicatus TaxID=995702 RepID=UPI00338F3562
MICNSLKNVFFVNYQQIRFIPRFTNSAVLKGNPQPLEITSPVASKKTPSENQDSFVINTPKTYENNHSQYPPSLVIRSKARNKPCISPIKPVTVTKQLITAQAHEKGPILDKCGNVVYTKMHNNDLRITKIMSDVKTNQKKSGLMLLEGKRLIREALLTGCEMEYLLFSRMDEVDYLKPYFLKSGRLYKIPYRELQSWSNLTTSPGVMGIFQIPKSESFVSKNPLPLTIICDNIREPSNLGSIVRISSGVGCEKLVLTKGCTNVWDDKVLRSASGAHFRIKLCKDISWNNIKSEVSPDSTVFLADNNVLSNCSNDSIKDLKELIENIPVMPYYTVDFRGLPHIVLIIGGETEGLSVESYKLAMEFKGARLNVPMNNGVDSLNSAIALGIISFEFKRQIYKGTL